MAANDSIQGATRDDRLGTSGHNHGQAEQRNCPAANQHPDVDSDSSDDEFPAIDSDEFKEIHRRWCECKYLIHSTTAFIHARAVCSSGCSASAAEGQEADVPRAQAEAVTTHQDNHQQRQDLSTWPATFGSYRGQSARRWQSGRLLKGGRFGELMMRGMRSNL